MNEYGLIEHLLCAKYFTKVLIYYCVLKAERY